MLRILEGDVVMDSNQISTPGHEVGSRSGRIWLEHHRQNQHFSGPMSTEILEGFGGKLSFETQRPVFWEMDGKNRRTSCGN